MRLRPFSFKEVLKVLDRLGFVVVRQKGGHIVLKGSYKGTKRTVVVPRHPEIAIGALRGILIQAGLDTEEFLKLAKKS